MKKNRSIILLLILAIIPLFSLFHSGMFVGHDTQLHVARIAHFYKSLNEGILIPRWAGDLNLGYGHPAFIFYYPLTSYIASAFHFLGFALIFSTKLVYGLGFMGSGLAMYLWVRQLWGDKAGLMSGLLYMYAPYRFVDLYIRGAIGENFFFIWPPLILYFLTKLQRGYKYKYLLGASLSLSALILSHNASSLMFLPFIGVYGLLLIQKAKNKIMLTGQQLLAAALGFGMSAFFWMPALLESKYTLQNVIMGDGIFKHFELFSRLVYSPWNLGGTGQFSTQVGVIQWLVVLLVTLVLLKKFSGLASPKGPVNDKLLVIVSYITFWVAILMILPVSKPVYEIVTIFKKFQFPWRWLSLAIFPAALLSGYLISKVSSKYLRITLLVIVVFSLISGLSMWKVRAYDHSPDNFYLNEYKGTTDSSGENSPVWSIRFMEQLPKSKVEVVEGEGEAQDRKRSSIRHEYVITAMDDKIRVLDNTLYFPGWSVYVDGKKLSLRDVWWQDPNYRGLITFFVEKGQHEIIVKFERTKIRLLAEIISLVSIGLLVGLPILSKVLWSKK